MKHKTIYILFFLIALVGCSDTADYNPGNYRPSLKAKFLSLSQKNFNFPNAEASVDDFTVTSMGTPWGFTEVMDWVSLSKTQGTKTENVSLTVTENFSGDESRLGVFFLESKDYEWNFKSPVSVFQPAAIPYAVPEISNVTFNGGASSQTIWVMSNCTWEYQTYDSWLTATKDEESGTLIINASENIWDYAREGYITITFNGEYMATIYVIQRAAEVSMETNTLTFENTAGTYELTLESEVSWTATTSHTWLNVSPASGNAGTSTLNITASANTSIYDRTGYVYIKVGDINKVEIPVRQRGLYIEFETNAMEFGAEGGEHDILIASNTSWEIVLPLLPSGSPVTKTIVTTPVDPTESNSWFTVSPMSGERDGYVKVTVAENPNVSSRTATITATQTGLNLSDTFVITQRGKVFNYGDVSTFQCSDKGQSLVVNVTSNGKWEATSNDSWISVSPESMTGSADLVITVEENTTDDTRTGTVTLTIGDQSYTLTVKQTGKYFTIQYTGSQFTSKGTSLSIDVITNDSWTARVEGNPSWITLSQTSGEGDVSIVATLADNPSVNDRTATIIIETPHGHSFKIPVSQAARYMTLDCQSVQFFAGGGTSQDIKITTDAQYSITCSDTWFYVTEKGNDVFCVTAEENTAKKQRDGFVTVAMTDLKEGTYSINLPVVQAANGASFTVIGYGDDNNLDLGAGVTFTLTVTGFGTDTNWDTPGGSNGLTVTITGYNDERDFDSESSSTSGSISNGGYGSDNDWN